MTVVKCERTGLSFLTEYYRSRGFDATTSLPKSNDFLDFSELLLDQTIPLALGSMRDADGYTPKESIELILQVLEYNNNEGNDFDDAEWIAAWLSGLEKVTPSHRLCHSAMLPSRPLLKTRKNGRPSLESLNAIWTEIV